MKSKTCIVRVLVLILGGVTSAFSSSLYYGKDAFLVFLGTQSHVYDLRTDVTYSFGTDLRSYDFGAAQFDYKGGYVFTAGGRNGNELKINILTENFQQWARLQTEIRGCATIRWGSDVYCIGGYNDKTQSHLDTIWMLPQPLNGWHDWEQTEAKLPKALYQSAAVVLKDVLFVMGGEDGSPCSTGVYYTRSNRNSFALWHDLKVARAGLSATVAGEAIYILGGWGNDYKSTDAVEVLDPWAEREGRLLTFTDFPAMIRPRYKHGAIYISDKNVILVCGGFDTGFDVNNGDNYCDQLHLSWNAPYHGKGWWSKSDVKVVNQGYLKAFLYEGYLPYTTTTSTTTTTTTTTTTMLPCSKDSLAS